MTSPSRWWRVVALLYVGALVGVPLIYLFDQALRPGWHAVSRALSDPQMSSAMWLTVRVAAVAIPANALFGIGASLWIVRRPSWASRVLDSLIDVPLAISPIIVGLILELAYAQNGWFGSALAALGWHLIFSYWGIVVASAFVALPLVSRQIIPLLRELGDRQEQTASTLGAGPLRIFFTVTLRSIQWAAAYGIMLSLARVIV